MKSKERAIRVSGLECREGGKRGWFCGRGRFYHVCLCAQTPIASLSGLRAIARVEPQECDNTHTSGAGGPAMLMQVGL